MPCLRSDRERGRRGRDLRPGRLGCSIRWDRALFPVPLGLVAIVLLVLATFRVGQPGTWLVPTAAAWAATLAAFGFLGEAEPDRTFSDYAKVLAASVAFLTAVLNAGFGYGPRSASPGPLRGWSVPGSIVLVAVVAGVILWRCGEKTSAT
jgi:hypothetical protein